MIPSQRLVTHSGIHSFLAGPLRSPARIQNTFANESFIDELAHAAGADPVAFRLAHLKDQRLIDVINLAAKMAKWQTRPAASKIGKGRFRTGRGIAAMLYEGNNGYNAAVFQVTVDTKTGKVVVDAVWSAQDCGPVLNPDGMRAQAEGGLMQAISRTLIEEVKWGANGITSKDWQTYPVIRFTGMPKTFHFQAIDRKDQPVWGAGEVLITNGPAAIANAIFDATGKRMRQASVHAGTRAGGAQELGKNRLRDPERQRAPEGIRRGLAPGGLLEREPEALGDAPEAGGLDGCRALLDHVSHRREPLTCRLEVGLLARRRAACAAQPTTRPGRRSRRGCAPRAASPARACRPPPAAVRGRSRTCGSAHRVASGSTRVPSRSRGMPSRYSSSSNSAARKSSSSGSGSSVTGRSDRRVE